MRDILAGIESTSDTRDILAGPIVRTGEVEKPGIDYADIGLGLADAPVRLMSGMAGWLGGKAGGLSNIVMGSFTDLTPEQITEMARETEGIIGEMFTPWWEQPEFSKTLLEPVEKGLDILLIPAKWVGKQGAKLDPRAGYVLEFLAELATFKGVHISGKYAIGKLKKLKGDFESGKISKAELDSLVEELGIEEANLKTPEGRQAEINKIVGEDLSTPEGRQARIDRLTTEPEIIGKRSLAEQEALRRTVGDEAALKDVEIGKQMEAFRSAIKRSETEAAGAVPIEELIRRTLAKEPAEPKRAPTERAPVEVKVEEPSPLIRRGEEEVVRTNRLAAEGVARQRSLLKELENAKSLRKDARQVREGRLGREGIKEESREDIQRKQKERTEAGIKEEAQIKGDIPGEEFARNRIAKEIGSDAVSDFDHYLDIYKRTQRYGENPVLKALETTRRFYEQRGESGFDFDGLITDMLKQLKESYDPRKNLKLVKEESVLTLEEKAKSPETKKAIDAMTTDELKAELAKAEERVPGIKKIVEEELASREAPSDYIEITKYKDTNEAKTDYDLYGRRRLNTVEEANKILAEDGKVQKKRAELQEAGSDLSVVQIGDKFALGERMAMEVPSLEVVDPQMALDRLQKLSKDIIAFNKGEEVSGIKTVVDEIAKIKDSVVNIDDIAKRETINKAADLMTEMYNKKVHADNIELQKSKGDLGLDDPEIILEPHPWKSKLITVLDKEGRTFENPFDALDWMKEKGIKGVVETHPDTGFVIELREPKKLVFKSRDIREKHQRYRAISDMANTSGGSTAVPVILSNKNLFSDLEINKLIKYFEEKGVNRQSVEIIAKELDISDLVDYNKVEIGASKQVSPEVRTFRNIMDDIIEAFKLDERGSVSFKDLKPEKVEVLRRLINDAARMGLTIKEYMTKVGGYSPKQIEGMDRLVREAAQDIDLTKPDTGLSRYETGKVINVGKMEKKVGDYTVRRPEITEGILKSLKDIEDPKRSTIGQMTKEYVTTPEMIKELKSPLYEDLHVAYWDLTKLEHARVKAHEIAHNEARKGLSTKNMENIATNLFWRQEDIRARMIKDGMTEGDIPKLTLEEQAYINYIDPILQDMGPRINVARTNSGHKPMKLLGDDYFTVAYVETWAERMGFEPNIFADKPGVVSSRYAAFTETPFKFRKSRSKEGLKKTVSLAADEIFDTYMRLGIKHELTTPFVAKLHEMLEPLKTGEFNKAGKEILFEMDKAKPNLAKWTRRWANYIAGRDPDAFMALKDTPANRVAEKWMRKGSQNLVTSTLSGSVRSALIQPAALINTTARIGKTHTAYGVSMAVRALFSPKEMARILDRSRNLSSRLADVSMAEYFRGLKRGKMRAASKLGMEALQRLDFVTAIATWLGAEKFALGRVKKARAKGRADILERAGIKERTDLSTDEIVRRFADMTVAETQASSLPGDIAPIQRSAFGRLAHTFQTFAISDWNFLYKQVFGIGKDIPIRVKAKRIMDLVIATTLFNSFYEDVLGVTSPAPTPIRAAYRAIEEGKDPLEVAMDVVKEVGEKIPGVGGLFKFGSSVMGAVVQTMTDFFKAFAEDESRRGSVLPKALDKGSAKKLALAAEAALKLRGVPFTGQAAKMARAAKRDETPAGIALGRYTKDKKKSSSGFGKFEKF